ncbi:MAG: hypothetical protein A3F42_02535 [Gammaproteobacteria bacterium RIFCSPHIGHO2_12_FULL_37_34]|nr:MAG: hypothetical protein A3F42_02535 [Gammaproteobacteria bacterium RIFCSPHIGHO2_12_FULL_37_34]
MVHLPSLWKFKIWINMPYVDWWLFILYHYLAELEEMEKEWKLTRGYQLFSKDDVALLMLYNGFKSGDFHAKEMHYAKKQIIATHKLEGEDEEQTTLEWDEWQTNLHHQLETIDDRVRNIYRERNASESEIFQTIVEEKKLLLHEYIFHFQTERIKLDIDHFCRLQKVQQDAQHTRFFVKRELARYFHDYLKYEEKKIFFELLFEVGIILKKTDGHHLAEKYSDLHGLEEKKTWYKQCYYYSSYYELHQHNQSVLYSCGYFNHYIERSYDKNELNDEDINESLKEKKERLRSLEKQKRQKEIEKIQSNRIKKRESSKKYENLIDSVGYLQLAKGLNTLLVLDIEELCDFDEIVNETLQTYLTHFNVPHNYKQDAVKKAQAFFKLYFSNLLCMSKGVDTLLDDASHFLTEEEKPLQNLMIHTKRILSTYATPTFSQEDDHSSPIKQTNKKNKSNGLFRLAINMLLMSLFVTGLVVAGIVTMGMVPSIALVTTMSLGAIGISVGGNIATVLGMSAISLSLGLVGGAIGMIISKCITRRKPRREMTNLRFSPMTEIDRAPVFENFSSTAHTVQAIKKLDGKRFDEAKSKRVDEEDVIEKKIYNKHFSKTFTKEESFPYASQTHSPTYS